MINDVQPLCAWHYNPGKIEDIGQCLSLPYDVISPGMQEDYYTRHPYNIIRLILNRKQPEDNEVQNQYTRAAALLAEWKKQEILVRSHTPAFWVYEQEYELAEPEKKRLNGFIGLVKLADFEEMRILPHEKILKGPYEDRIKLTRQTHTQLEYIWSIYQDRDSVIDEILFSREQTPPLINHYQAELRVRHRLWKLQDPRKCEMISRIMSEKQIFIADGHHRYNTMLAIRDEMRKRYPAAGPDAPWEYIMMYLTNSAHEGLVVRPTHRMVHNLGPLNETVLLNKLASFFHIRDMGSGTSDSSTTRQWVNAVENCSPEKRQFGLYLPGGKYYILELKDSEDYLRQFTRNHSREWKMLDVNILNSLLLKKILGISEEQLALNTHIKYSVDAHEAVEKTDRGEMQMAFILNATPLEAVINVSLEKEVMPRKSTYFYPKPLSGLILYEMDSTG